MTEAEQTQQFCNELDRLVDRFSMEYQMSYAALVGALHIKAHALIVESFEDEEEDYDGK